MFKNFEHQLPVKKAKSNSADPDQTASAVWSGSSLFDILTSSLWFPALKTNILFENRKRKEFEILEHLPYITLLLLLW